MFVYEDLILQASGCIRYSNCYVSSLQMHDNDGDQSF